MATTTVPATAASGSLPAPPTPREDRRVLAGGTVLILGLFADGWAHTNIVDELESFLSPYHAVIALGFALSAAAVLGAVRARRLDGAGTWAATPMAYRPALLGVVGFAIGFTGDGIWHTLLGIENGIDALLSPTHLLMAGSILAIVTAPLRAWDDRHGTADELPWRVVGSVAAASLVVSFFLMYAWATSSGLLRVGDGDSLNEAAGLMQTMLTSAVMATTVAVLLARGTPPRGALAAVLVGVPVAQHAIVELELAWLLIGAVAGAAAVEVLVHRAPRARPELVTAAWALATWTSTWLVLLTLEGGSTWSADLMSGQVVLGTATAWWVATRVDRAATRSVDG